jgi:hypothetical protein
MFFEVQICQQQYPYLLSAGTVANGKAPDLKKVFLKEPRIG